MIMFAMIITPVHSFFLNKTQKFDNYFLLQLIIMILIIYFQSHRVLSSPFFSGVVSYLHSLTSIQQINILFFFKCENFEAAYIKLLQQEIRIQNYMILKFWSRLRFRAKKVTQKCGPNLNLQNSTPPSPVTTVIILM